MVRSAFAAACAIAFLHASTASAQLEMVPERAENAPRFVASTGLYAVGNLFFKDTFRFEGGERGTLLVRHSLVGAGIGWGSWFSYDWWRFSSRWIVGSLGFGEDSARLISDAPDRPTTIDAPVWLAGEIASGLDADFEFLHILAQGRFALHAALTDGFVALMPELGVALGVRLEPHENVFVEASWGMGIVLDADPGATESFVLGVGCHLPQND